MKSPFLHQLVLVIYHALQEGKLQHGMCTIILPSNQLLYFKDTQEFKKKKNFYSDFLRYFPLFIKIYICVRFLFFYIYLKKKKQKKTPKSYKVHVILNQGNLRSLFI